MKTYNIKGKMVKADSYEATAYIIGKVFDRVDFFTLPYKSIVLKVASLPRYFKLPDDAIEDLVSICEKSEMPPGKNKLDIVLAHFEHAITCRVMKKFDLSNKQKQLLFSAFGFLDIFLEENIGDKNVKRLHDCLSRVVTRYSDEMETQLTYAYKQFNKITDGKDMTIDYLVFASSLCLAFVDSEPDIDKKLLDKLLKLSTSIYNKSEKYSKGNDRFKTSVKLVGKFTNNIIKGKNFNSKKIVAEINRIADTLIDGVFPYEDITLKYKVTTEYVDSVLFKRDDFEVVG